MMDMPIIAITDPTRFVAFVSRVDDREEFLIVTVTAGARVTELDALEGGASYDVDVSYDERLERYVASSVTVTRSGEGSEVTSRLIRTVTVQEIVESVALSELTTVEFADADGDRGMGVDGATALTRIMPAAGREHREVAQDAWTVSRLAKLGGRPPLVTVADTLQVSHSTAKRLVKSMEYLGPGTNPEWNTSDG